MRFVSKITRHAKKLHQNCPTQFPTPARLRDIEYSRINLRRSSYFIYSMLYITEELSFDKYHEKADRIYRISSDITEPDNAFKWAVTQFPLAPTLKKDYAEIEEYVRFIPNGRTRLQKDQNQFFEERVYLVDSTVFDIFTFEFVEGNPETALDAPNKVVLSQSVATKIFGNNSAVGQTLESDAEEPYEVTGVIKDMPRNSHIIADVMVSANTIPDVNNAGSWGGFGIYSYVLVKRRNKTGNL